MSADLIARADALRAKYKVLESTAGTGYHDNDRNPTRPELFAAPQRNGLPRASEHLVPFYDHDEEVVHFVGADAEKAAAALKEWAAKYARADVSAMPGTERKLLLKIIPKLAVATVDGAARLSVWLSDWNDVVHALYAHGVGLSGLSLDPAQTT